MRTTELLNTSLLPPGSRVLCAVSGGADSVCLLSLLREREELQLVCAHFNHCLRGEESERDEAFVRELCARWNIPCVTGRADVRALAAENRQSVETAAREARYAFLEKTAAERGCDLIATAHNADDQAETVLFRLARGTSLKGLGGIPERRGNIVRPLLRVPRSEILAFLAREGIPHVEDSTNASEEAARNRLRHSAMPVLRSVNSAAAENLCRTSRLLREDEDYLSAAAEGLWEELWDGESLPLFELRSMPRAMSRRLLARAAGRTLGEEEGEAVLSLADAGPSTVLELRGIRAERRYDRLLFVSPESRMPVLPVRELCPGETAVLPGYTVFCELLPPGSSVQSSLTTFSFSYGKIEGTLSVTPRREGDRLTLLHREGERSVHRLMIDAKLPRALRDTIPTLRDGRGVLAVYGFGQSRRAAAAPEEAQLRITIIKNDNSEENDHDDG